MEIENRIQKRLYVMVEQVANLNFDKPGVDFINDKLVHIRGLAKENNEEAFLEEAIKKIFGNYLKNGKEKK